MPVSGAGRPEEQVLTEVRNSPHWIVCDTLADAIATARKAGASDREIFRLIVLVGAAQLPGGWKEIEEMAASLSRMAEQFKAEED